MWTPYSARAIIKTHISTSWHMGISINSTVGIEPNDTRGWKELPTCRIPSNSGKTAKVWKASSDRSVVGCLIPTCQKPTKTSANLWNSDVNYISTYVYSSASYVRTYSSYVE